MVAKSRERLQVRRHRMICKEAANDFSEPFPLLGNRLMPPLSQLLLDLFELCSQAVAPGFPLEKKSAPARFAADESEAQEVEGLRLAEPAPGAVASRVSAKLDEPGLLGVECKSELLEPCAHQFQEAASIVLMLEANHNIVGVARDDHIAASLTPSPLLGPKVENVVEVDIGEQRWDHRSLTRPPVTDFDRSVFENSRL
jgi:hypothetical protein